MLSNLREQLKKHLEQSLKKKLPATVNLPSIELDIPAEKIHGEFSCNIALKSAKLLQKSPIAIAEQFCAIVEQALPANTQLNGKIAKIEVKKPGFINFFLTPAALREIITDIFRDGNNYGRSTHGQDKKVQVEFVSANPTGPLSVAHARQAAQLSVFRGSFQFRKSRDV